MAFPETILQISVALLLDGTWTDISSDVYERDEIRITRGRRDEGSDVDPGRCAFTLNNSSGDYSPRNPRGLYYGQIGRNTPVRVSVPGTSTYLAIDSEGDLISTPDHATLDITGDIDVRAEARLHDWLVTDRTFLMGKYDTNQQSWLLLVGHEGEVLFAWSTTGIDFIQRESTATVTVPATGKLAVRATLDVDNGAAGHTVTFYTSDSIDGTWTQLGDPVVTAGVTSIFSSTASLDVGDVSNFSFAAPFGEILKAEVRSGISGSVVANPDFTAQTDGATSFVDGSGRTWTVSGAEITSRLVRFHGEVSEWPVRWGTGGFDVHVRVEAAGILRRLGQGAAPLQSTLRRRIPTDTSLLAYWPMEEGQNSTQAFSPIAGVRPMTVKGLDFASVDTLAGTSPLPTLDSQSGTVEPRLYGVVPTSSATEWRTEFLYFMDAGPTSERTFMRTRSSGTVRDWTISMSSTGGTLLGADTDGIAVVNHAFPWAGTIPFGSWHRLVLTCVQNGGNVDYALDWIEVDENTISISGSYAGTVGRVTAMSAPSGGYHSDLDGLGLGHIAVFSDADSTIFNFADHGYNQETAGARLIRLRNEESVPLTVYGTVGDQEQMGPQTPQTLLTLFGEAADVDGGILYEARSSTRVAYRDRSTLYNQAVALTLDYAGTDGLVTPLEPTDDDQQLRNDVTITRTGGSSARATATTGPLSSLAPPDGVGRYDQATTLNLYQDAQTKQHASWHLHLGTWDESRYPVVRMLLQNAVALIETAASVGIGDRMQITNPPVWLPPEAIDLLVQGYTEVLHQKRWELEFNCSPSGPWEVGVRDDADRARRGTAGSELALGVDADDTALSVSTTLGPLWVTSADQSSDFPFDILVGGERMTVIACGTVLNSNTGFEVDTAGWTAVNATLARSSAQAKSGSWSGLLTSGAGSSPRAEDALRAVVAAQSYTAAGWLYAPLALPTDAGLNINWFDAGSVYLSTSSNTAALTPGVWTQFDATFTAPATAAFASLHFTITATPGAGHELYGDNLILLDDSVPATTSPQAFTVVRSINSISKAHLAAAAVALPRPTVRAL